MYEFGQGKTLLKTSEVRPEGFSYYNRVFNNYGDDPGPDQSQGQTYHDEADGEHERYQVAEEDHADTEYYPDSDGQLSGHSSGPGPHSTSGLRDQFGAEPDVREYYHFQSEKNEREVAQVPYIPSYARAAETDGDYHSVQENNQHYPPAQTDHRAPPPVYEELHHSEHRSQNRFSGDDIGYPDVQFYDDFDDYGIEMEFENELRRLTEVEEDESNGARSGGQESGYPRSDLRPRVYVGGGDYGEDMDFHYPSDFDY